MTNMMKEDSFGKRTAKNVFSGTMAGIAVTLFGHPFDTLKVRLQTQPTMNPVYSGLTDCFMKTMRWEGIGGLYKGVGSPLAGQMVYRSVLFASYYQVVLTSIQGRKLLWYDHFIVGTGTGFVAALVESPIELFKTQMQVEILRAKTGGTPQYRNVFHAGYVIASRHGVRGVYQGLGATWQRNAPAVGIYFGFYELIRELYTPPGGSVSDITTLQQFSAGGIAGFLYWFLTYPTDVIKSAMQSDNIEQSNRKYSSIADCARKLYHNEGGWRRFFKGFAPCLLRSVPANAIVMYVVEKCRHLLAPY